ncbi:hypothetical protein [Jeotgalicoccus sp. FSL K6-3177]|uniref:hypothetical protein n=1 Tax=Jeotgalicoccus sp. FSL K6-3177 TaxID=2921494 RepID=UPI0030FD532E
MSYEFATDAQIEEYTQTVKVNNLSDYVVSESVLRAWTTTRIEIEIEYLEEVALQKEALAAAYFNEF